MSAADLTSSKGQVDAIILEKFIRFSGRVMPLQWVPQTLGASQRIHKKNQENKLFEEEMKVWLVCHCFLMERRQETSTGQGQT